MIKITTESGSVYELYPDTKNWKRSRGQDANWLEIETGIYEEASYDIGERLILRAQTPSTHPKYPSAYTVFSTPVVSIEDV